MNQTQANTIAYMIGSLLPFIAVIVAGIFFGSRLGRKKVPPKFVWWPSLVAVPIASIAIVTGFANIGSKLKAQGIENGEAQREVFVFENQYPGDRFADLTDEQLRAIERAADARVKAMLQGLGQPTSPLSSIAKPTTVNGLYAVQVETRRDSELITFAVIGLVGKTLVDISCVPSDGHRATFKYEGSDCQNIANERIVRSPAS